MASKGFAEYIDKYKAKGMDTRVKEKKKIMKDKIKRCLCLLLAVALLSVSFGHTFARADKAVTCKSLCSAVLKATGGSSNLKYASKSALDFGGLSAAARKKVKSIQYVCDEKEVYSICIIMSKNISDAKKVLAALNQYKKSNGKSDYLNDYSATEQKVLKNAVCGMKGKYVWYIAMSKDKSKNNKGQTAIKKLL